MTLSELKYIVAVARERHFGRASKACFVSQPTLSVAVKKIEEELGVIIFERGSNEIGVTPVGKQLVAQAQVVLEAAGEMRQIASGDSRVEPIRIGVIFTIGPYLLPHLIPALKDVSPDLPVIVEEGFTADLRTRLKQGSLDIIIISLPFSESGVEVRPVYEEPFVVVLPSSHPWSQKETIQTAELEEETVLLLGEGNCFREQVIEVCPGCLRNGRGNDIQKSLESSSIETIRHMVASGVGVTVLPCSAAGASDYSRRLLSIKRFTDSSPRRKVVIAWRKGYPRMEAVDHLTQAIQECPMSCVKML